MKGLIHDIGGAQGVHREAAPEVIARDSVVNQDVSLAADDFAMICGPPAVYLDFIQRT